MKNYFFGITMVLILSSPLASAFGPTGHRTVGKIAENYLSAKAKKEIKKLLDGNSLARVSTWPDKIRSAPEEYSHTYPWHYATWPIGQKKYSYKKTEGLLLVSLDKNINILKDQSRPKEKRSFALKFIVHQIGDLHQPLHIGNGKDRGGNACKVYFHKDITNLHRLWDTNLIAHTKLSYTELSSFIIKTHKKNTALFRKGTPLTWAKESRNLRELIYPKNLHSENEKKQSLNKTYCQYSKTPQVQDDQIPRLSYLYSYQFMPILEKRIFQAGVRLAKILNNSLQ